jgi:hypothetical protein
MAAAAEWESEERGPESKPIKARDKGDGERKKKPKSEKKEKKEKKDKKSSKDKKEKVEKLKGFYDTESD